MKKRISATEARIHFGEVMRAAQENPIIVERDGKPLVVVISKRHYDKLAARTPGENWRILIADVHERIKKELGDRDIPSVENMIHQVREERDEQYDNLR